MSIRLITGRSGVGKTRQILTEIKEKCDEFPQGDPIFVIVPDQMSFHTEYQLLKLSKYPSLMRVQGLSFNRLAYRVLQETGGLSRNHLNDVGLAILLQKVMNEKKGELKVFSSAINKPGFVQKINEIISEFKSYCIEPEHLIEIFQSQDSAFKLSFQSAQKLKDLALLYESFNQTALNQYLMSEDYYTLLIEKIASSQLIANSDFYIDGYHLFNKQEELILFELMKYANSVTVVMTHDLHSFSQIFTLSNRTFSRLTDEIEAMGLTYEIEEIYPHAKSRFLSGSALAHLEQNFLQHPGTSEVREGISFFSAVNRRVEVEEVAKRIYQLVHQQGYAYSDIAIYTGDIEGYGELVAPIFNKFAIPFFLDAKESMLYHPLMTMLYHLFDFLTHGWSQENLFTLIKTGLFMDVSKFKKGQSFYQEYQNHQQQVDQLENYCLARHMTKKDWLSRDLWKYERYRGLGRDYVRTDEDLALEEQLNQIRHLIATPLSVLEKAVKTATTYKDFAISIFNFLEAINAPQKLALLEENAIYLEDITQLKQHEQVWTCLLSLLEQLVEIGQDEEVTLEDFANVFKSGLSEMNYTTVPPRLDQVAIGELRRSRYQLVNDLKEPGQYGIKHAFVLGVNEGQIPKIQLGSSLINETEREQLNSLGIELAPSLEQGQIDDQFILYTIFTSPKNSLTLSYVSSNDEGKEFLPSYIYSHIKKLFPNITEAHISREIETDIYHHLTTVKQSVAQVITALKVAPQRRSYYEPLLDYYQEHFPLIAQIVWQALNYQNEATTLDHELTKEIYSDEIVASVSRLELFNKCEFAHYLRYGLKLQERELYQLDLPHIGELYHEALKRIALIIQRNNRSFADLTMDECQTLAKQVADELSEQLLYKILKRNQRMIKLTTRLTQVVYKTLVGLKYQGEKSIFKPLFFELPFDTKANPGIQLKPRTLSNGFKLSLKGIVDRIDVAQTDNQAYLRVIDYKSSQKALTLDSVYYGLSLQLLTYLDVVIAHSFQIIDAPAEVGGLLYFHVHHPLINQDEELLQQADLEEVVGQLQREKYKMTGYLPEDYEVATLSDQRLTGEKMKSDIVPVTLKKDGSFSSVGNALLTKANLNILRAYTHQKIEDSALKITQGCLDINPTKYGQTKACDYCQYRAICQFDVDFSGNKLRNLSKIKPDRVLEAMETTIKKGGEADDST